MANGRARQRRLMVNQPSYQKVTWIFTSDAEAIAFESWFKEALKNGVEWFNCPLKTPMGEKHYVCRFMETYSGPDLFGICSWRVSAELELYEKPVFAEGWGEYADWLVFAPWLDIIVNRKLPEYKEE